MKILPIAIIDPALGQLLAGRLSKLRRPLSGQLGTVAPGDLLWIREPFHLKAAFDNAAPTVARQRGAVAVFPAGQAPGGIAAMGLGRLRHARELPRAMHRHHLLVTGVARQPLQDITDAQIRAEGLPHRAAWAALWDAGMTLGDRAHLLWEANPEVLCLSVELQRRPAPDKAEDRDDD